MPKRSGLVLTLFSLLLSTAGARDLQGAASEGIGSGRSLPGYEFLSPKAPEDRAYLGILHRKAFTIADIQADLVVLEILNTYCTSCQKQAPFYNTVFHMLEKDPATRGWIKWIGEAVGNNEREVASFRRERAVPFPILADEDFGFYDALTGPSGARTPLTILLRRDEGGRAIIVESHVGFRGDTEEISRSIKAALEHRPASLKIRQGEATVPPLAKRLPPPLSEQELSERIKPGISFDGAYVLEIRRIRLAGGDIYVAKVEKGSHQEELFAVPVSRPPVCDICHGIRFIYIFDKGGTVRNFIPVDLRKYGNRSWDDQDINQMRDRLLGRSLIEPFKFNRGVDAVTRATITSVVIFAAMNKGKALYTDLARKTYIRK